MQYYHRATFLQLTTFLQFHLASSILPQSPYFLHWYFLFRCSLYKYEFHKIYYCAEKLKCDDIHCKKVLLDPQSTRHSPAFNILLQLYSFYFITCPICYIWVLREIRAKLPVLDDLWAKPLEFQSPLTKHILFSSHHGRSWTLCGASLGNTWSDFEFSSLANCKKVGPKPSAAYYNE